MHKRARERYERTGRVGRALAGLALGVAAACSSPPARQTTAPPRPPETNTPAAVEPVAPVEPAEAYRVGEVAGAPAPWLEAPLADADCAGAKACAEPSLWNEDLEESDALLAVGTRAAAVATLSGVFIYDLDRGIIGPLAVPEVNDSDAPPRIGFGTGDEVFFVTPAGQLFWAADARAATRSLSPRGSVAGARAWDFAPGLVAAASGKAIWVSTDGGKKFRESIPAKGATFTSVLARSDGVVVAEAEDAAIYVSRDRGRAWRKSRLGGGSPVRDGAWISICEDTLSADGMRWSSAERPARDDVSVWTAPFSLGDRPRGHAVPHPVTAVDPSPPKAPGPRDEASGTTTCSGPPGRDPTRGVASGGYVGGALGFSPYGLERMTAAPVGPAPHPTRTHYAFLADGVCAEEHRVSADDSGCEPDAPLTRLPHVVAIDRESSQMVMFSVPSGCAPERISDAMGAGVLFCRSADGELSVELFGSSGPAARETSMRFAATATDALGIFGDGSLLSLAVSSDVDAPLAAAVRKPAPLGTIGAWRTVAVPGAIAYRLGPRGLVVAVVRTDVEGERFDLVLDRDTGGEREVLVRAQPVEGGLADVAFAADGRIEVRRHGLDGKESRLFVTKAGGLAPAVTD